MPKAKSSVKDVIVNVLLLAVAAGVLAWRYNDCKKKEMAAEQAAVKSREDADQAHERRTNACLTSVSEDSRGDCIRCTCSACLDEYEICAGDKDCLAITVDMLLADGGPPPENLSRVRYEQRAACMFSKCGQECTTRR